MLTTSMSTMSSHRQTQQTQNICITFIQRRPNVFDVGPTLYKCYTNVLCLLEIERSNSPSVIISLRDEDALITWT